MKSLAVLAATAALLISGTLQSVAARHGAVAGRHPQTMMLLLPTGHSMRPGLQWRRATLEGTDTLQPQQAVGTGTDTPTPTPTTGPSYPDPVSLLQKMSNVLALIRAVHFVVTADLTGSPTINVKADGDTTQQPVALKALVTAKASIPGTSQSQSQTFNAICVKGKGFIKAKSTKQRWAGAGYKKLEPYGFPLDSPLTPGTCPQPPSSGTGTGSGSGSGSNDQIKDLVNQGPATYDGFQVWHLHATDVSFDPSTNQTTTLPLDWYIDQQHSLLYGYVVSFTDPTQDISQVFTTKLSKYGEKVKITAPKKGSTTP